MKLYMHPVSMTSRPVRLFIHEKGLEVEEQMIDLMAGEHYGEVFTAINPSRLVPVLEDDGFRLTESSAILKYLAEKFDLPEYPKELKERAKVNEIMDWFNTNFYRDWAYNFIYPQLFPHHRRPSEEAQAGTIRWGKERSTIWLQILNNFWLGPDRRYLRGERITIADHFGICLLTLGEIIRVDFGTWPNVARWLGTMKQLNSWPEVNEVLYGFAASVSDQQFETL